MKGKDMKTAWKKWLALALMVATMFIVSISALAADTYTVSGTFKVNDKAPEDPFTFSLFKVGTFGHKDDGKATFVLDDAIDADVDLDIDKSNYDTEKEWQDAWLENAQNIADCLPDSFPKACDDVKTDSDGQFSFAPGVENGLYLLLSNNYYEESQDDGSTVRWSALPMLVMVLNEDVDLTVKPSMEIIEQTREYSVVKSWQDTGHQSVRPKEIKVEIYYDYKTGKKNTPIETVTLNASNNWSYSWKTTDEKYIGLNKAPYTVKEVLTNDIQKTYSLKYSDNEDKEKQKKTYNITNVYKNEEKSSSKVKTGDTNNMKMYYIIGAAALVVLVLLFVRMRKNRKDDGQA